MGHCPIIYANDDLVSLLGRRRDEVIGKSLFSCRLWMGPLSDIDQWRRLEQSVRARHEMQFNTLLYHSDGTNFVCRLSISLVRNTPLVVLFFEPELPPPTKQRKMSRIYFGGLFGLEPNAQTISGQKSTTDKKEQRTRMIAHFFISGLSMCWSFLLLFGFRMKIVFENCLSLKIFFEVLLNYFQLKHSLLFFLNQFFFMRH